MDSCIASYEACNKVQVRYMRSMYMYWSDSGNVVMLHIEKIGMVQTDKRHGGNSFIESLSTF